MVILGLADGVDAGAALIVDDRLVAAAEQERHDQVPRSRTFPWEAIDAVLQQTGLRERDVDLVAVAGRFTPPFFVRRHPGVRSLASSAFSPALDAQVFVQAVLRQSGFGAMEADRAAEWLDGKLRERGFRQQRVILVDVHRALAAAAYRAQPDDEVLTVTLHPMGDGVACAVYRGIAGQLDRLWEQKGFAALHVHLARCAEAMGLQPLAEDARLWALAARGEPDPQLLRELREALHAEGPRLSRRQYPLPDRAHAGLYRALSEAPREVAAASIYENLRRSVVAVVRHHATQRGARRIAVGGAVFENPRLVADVAELSCLDEVAMCPLAGWAALPVGAALSLGGLAPGRLRPPGLGQAFDNAACEHALHAVGVEPERATIDAVADVIAAGGAVARFVGRAGFGRYGAGTRTVLVRADVPAAVQRAREALGAPEESEPGLAVLDGVLEAGRHASKLVGPTLYGAAAVHAPPEAEQLAAGALTADGRVLLQRVCDGDDPGLAELLRAVRERTGVPALACWPLSRAVEPVVAYPADAVRVWRASDLDALWLGPFLARGSGG